MRKLFVLGLTVMCLIAAPLVFAADTEWGMVGTTIRPFECDGVDYMLASIPMIEVQIPIKEDKLFGMVGMDLDWGVKGGFTFVGTLNGGIDYYPVRYAGIYAKGGIGSFILNDFLMFASAGVHVKIPFNDSVELVLGGEYFTMKRNELIGFIDPVEKPQWYADGDGIGFTVAVRFLQESGY